MQLGDLGECCEQPSGVRGGRKRILKNFGAPETESGDMKFHVFTVRKN